MEAKEELSNILLDPKEYMENLVSIKTKTSEIVKLKLNPMQDKVYEIIETKKNRFNSIKLIVLKARQHGISTLVISYGFHNVVTNKNRSFAVVTHEEKATTNLFERIKLTYTYLPSFLKPTLKYSNAIELKFQSEDTENSLNSGIKCYTAGSTEIGRSETINVLLMSEFAFWNPTFANDNYSSIMQAVPLENSIVVIESTAKGFNHFKDLWDDAVAGKNEYIPIFIPWFENPEYMIDDEITNKTEDELELQKLFELTDSQLVWRRWCLSTNCKGDINKFHQEYPSTPEEAFVNSGTPVFNNENIMKRIEILRQQYEKKKYDSGCFRKREFIKNINNYVKIYEYPKKGRKYVIGVDTAGDGSDNYGVTVIDNYTGKRVATVWFKIPANEVADQVEALGYFYNEAFISVEINFNIYLVLELERREYPNQYIRKLYDNNTGKHKDAFGWKTDGNTRPLIITAEQILINDNIDLFNDIDMLQECLTFVKDTNGRPDAMSGKHDDLIFSDMIAEAAREQQDVVATEEKEKPKIKVHKSLKEDYENATDAVKKMMVERYGDVF